MENLIQWGKEYMYNKSAFHRGAIACQEIKNFEGRDLNLFLLIANKFGLFVVTWKLTLKNSCDILYKSA